MSIHQIKNPRRMRIIEGTWTKYQWNRDADPNRQRVEKEEVDHNYVRNYLEATDFFSALSGQREKIIHNTHQATITVESLVPASAVRVERVQTLFVLERHNVAAS